MAEVKDVRTLKQHTTTVATQCRQSHRTPGAVAAFLLRLASLSVITCIQTDTDEKTLAGSSRKPVPRTAAVSTAFSNQLGTPTTAYFLLSTVL